MFVNSFRIVTISRNSKYKASSYGIIINYLFIEMNTLFQESKVAMDAEQKVFLYL